MNSYNKNVFFAWTKMLRLNAVFMVLIPLFVISGFYPLSALADAGTGLDDEDSSVINISSAGGRYTLLVEKKNLSDVLLKLKEIADFKLKIFDDVEDEQVRLDIKSMPLNQLLTNLLRGYNTVMLYEESKNNELDSDGRKLKELWLIGSDNGARTDHDIINIEIDLNEPENLTLEQQYELTHIDNLEGMISDDVIETLQQTLLTEKDPVIRKRAVVALSDIGGTHVLDALESGMGDNSGEVRAEIARSLAGIKNQKSMLLLGQMLMGDGNVEVRQEAVRALRQQDSPAARSFVEAALQDNAASVNKVAKEILQQWVLVPAN
jgi:hypothetical protein